MVLFRWVRTVAALALSASLVILLFLLIVLGGIAARPVRKDASSTVPLAELPVMETLPFSETATAPPTEATAPREGYLLLLVEGRLAVCNAQGEVITLLPKDARTLPPAAREELSLGIPAATREELLSLIADYTQ